MPREFSQKIVTEIVPKIRKSQFNRNIQISWIISTKLVSFISADQTFDTNITAGANYESRNSIIKMEVSFIRRQTVFFFGSKHALKFQSLQGSGRIDSGIIGSNTTEGAGN